MQPHPQTVAPTNHCPGEPNLSATLILACTVLVLATSLALLAAAWFMVSKLLHPDLFVPISWIGFVDV